MSQLLQTDCRPVCVCSRALSGHPMLTRALKRQEGLRGVMMGEESVGDVGGQVPNVCLWHRAGFGTEGHGVAGHICLVRVMWSTWSAVAEPHSSAMARCISSGWCLCTQRLCSPTAVGGACSRSWSLHPCGVDVPAATSPAATRLWQGTTGATLVSFSVAALSRSPSSLLACRLLPSLRLRICAEAPRR